MPRSGTCALLLLAACSAPAPFVIRVVDEATGRGVPLVELRTTSGVSHHTDNAGVIALDESGRRFFLVESPGYEAPAGGFGIRGLALDPRPGAEAVIRIRRLQVAERLYRITGEGLYHHSVRAGLPTPLRRPLLNAGVTGQDSAMVLLHRGKLHWFWGDTNLAGRALGHFGTATATSEFPGRPDAGIDLDYAVDREGLSRPTFDLGRPGPVWAHGGFVLKDPEGRERILTQYERVKDLGHRLELGIAVFDDETRRFQPITQLDLNEKRHPFGQAFRSGDHIYFAAPYPLLRVRARWEDVLDPTRYEAFTCLTANSSIERDASGKASYAWRKGAVPVDPDLQEKLIRAGRLTPEEAWIRTVDASGEKPIRLHRGSVRWNAFRSRWIMIATRIYGDESILGEVYYAEAPAPEGPWRRAVKIAGHGRYSFYNPAHHDFFDQEGGRLIYFEGTYTMTFSKATAPTPLYDYNQIMYRLDLSDPRLIPARE